MEESKNIKPQSSIANFRKNTKLELAMARNPSMTISKKTRPSLFGCTHQVEREKQIESQTNRSLAQQIPQARHAFPPKSMFSRRSRQSFSNDEPRLPKSNLPFQHHEGKQNIQPKNKKIQGLSNKEGPKQSLLRTSRQQRSIRGRLSFTPTKRRGSQCKESKLKRGMPGKLSFKSQNPPSFGLSIDDFQIGPLLHEGEFSRVYLARHRVTGTIYSIKQTPITVGQKYQLANIISNQVKIHWRLNHPNVVKLYGFFADYRSIYLLCQYLNGGSLNQKIAKSKLVLTNVNGVIRQVSQGVKYLHETGGMEPMHREITSQNILITNGVYKLWDFGLVSLESQKITSYRVTSDYERSKISQKKECSLSADIMSIGVLAYQMVVGRLPFSHQDKKQTVESILQKGNCSLQFPPDTPIEAQNFILRLLERDPKLQYSIQDLLSDSFLVSL